MSDGQSDRLALPFLSAGQAQKEIFHNEALARIDLMLHAAAQSADLSTPPAAPEAGQCWIVATGASGPWAGQDGRLAGWTDGGWRFCGPVVGMRVTVADRGHVLVYGVDGWRDAAVRADGYFVDGARIVGTRQAAIAEPVGGTVVDAEARSTIGAMLAMLRLHGLIESD